MFSLEIPIPNGRIRELEEKDIASLTAMIQDDEILNNYFLTTPEDYTTYWHHELLTQQRLRGYYGWQRRPAYVLTVEHEGIVKGVVGIHPDFCLFEDEKPSVQIDHFLGVSFRGRGLGRIVVNTTTRFVFEKFDAKEVIARCYADNPASQKILVYSGFRLHEAFFQKGAKRESLVYKKT